MAIPPGSLVFGRRRVLQALQPGDGPPNPPICPPTTAFLTPTLVLRSRTFALTETFTNPTEILRGPNIAPTETILNPAVVLASP